MKFHKLLGAFVAALILVTACKKDDPTPTPPSPWDDKTLISQKTIDGTGLIVSLYADHQLETGYNELYVSVLGIAGTNGGAAVDVVPLMDMGSTVHSAPVESFDYDATLKGYKGAVVFIMPSAGGTWSLNIGIDDLGNQFNVDIPINVVASDPAKLMSGVSMLDGTTPYFVSLIQPMEPKTGINTFEVAVHRRETMMSFPPVADLKVFIEPEMPTMGHGSPNNVDPTETADGHYVGQVNFTMTGLWHVNLTLANAAGDTILTNKYFVLEF